MDFSHYLEYLTIIITLSVFSAELIKKDKQAVFYRATVGRIALGISKAETHDVGNLTSEFLSATVFRLYGNRLFSLRAFVTSFLFFASFMIVAAFFLALLTTKNSNLGLFSDIFCLGSSVISILVSAISPFLPATFTPLDVIFSAASIFFICVFEWVSFAITFLLLGYGRNVASLTQMFFITYVDISVTFSTFVIIFPLCLSMVYLRSYYTPVGILTESWYQYDNSKSVDNRFYHDQGTQNLTIIGIFSGSDISDSDISNTASDYRNYIKFNPEMTFDRSTMCSPISIVSNTNRRFIIETHINTYIDSGTFYVHENWGDAAPPNLRDQNLVNIGAVLGNGNFSAIPSGDSNLFYFRSKNLINPSITSLFNIIPISYGFSFRYAQALQFSSIEPNFYLEYLPISTGDQCRVFDIGFQDMSSQISKHFSTFGINQNSAMIFCDDRVFLLRNQGNDWKNSCKKISIDDAWYTQFVESLEIAKAVYFQNLNIRPGLFVICGLASTLVFYFMLYLFLLGSSLLGILARIVPALAQIFDIEQIQQRFVGISIVFMGFILVTIKYLL